MTAVMYHRFNVPFRLRYGSPTCEHKPPSDTHHFIFFHVRPANQQPTITVWTFAIKTLDALGSLKHVIQYQLSVLLHNARFHSQCYTSDKSSNKTCENNIIPPTNIQYLKIHVRNWIRSQTSQRYRNRMVWTWGDKLQPTAVRTLQHYLHKQANTAMTS
jgi:hypothetical protein